MYALTDRCWYSKTHVAAESCTACGVREVSICRDVCNDTLRDMEDMSQRRQFSARQTLFNEGDRADMLFNVLRGMVRLYKLLSNGRRQIVGFALPGDFLGLALEQTYKVSADAITEVEVCRFERRAFVNCVENRPDLLRSLHAATSHELETGQEQMVLLGRRSAEERVAAFLLALRQRYQRIGACDATLWMPMTRQDVADYCGLTLETVSRTFSKLARDKLILIVPDGVRLIMIDRLQRLIA